MIILIIVLDFLSTISSIVVVVIVVVDTECTLKPDKHIDTRGIIGGELLVTSIIK